MTELGLPLLYALLVWWVSTGLILYLDSLSERTFRWSMLGASVVTLAAVAGIAAGANDASPRGAYLAFTGGLLVWGWLEMSYLMGFITGPRTRPCPPGVSGWARFVLALKTSLWHELSIVAAGVALLVLTRDAANPLAAWTFAVLWGMRWSSKLNIFFGVPNVNEEFLPEQLAYLRSFIRRRPMNWFFPPAVTVATFVTAALAAAALSAPAGSYASAAWGLLAALAFLGTLEHWFLVLPLKDAALFRWAIRIRESRQDGTPDDAGACPAARPGGVA